MVDEGLIAEAGRRLARAAGESAQVILFGSHARGNARTDSDLDFLVIEPEVENRRAESVRLRRELRGLGIAADVVGVSADHIAEWGEVKSTTLHEALTQGRLLAAACRPRPRAATADRGQSRQAFSNNQAMPELQRKISLPRCRR